jgi:hypothetical protein
MVLPPHLFRTRGDGHVGGHSKLRFETAVGATPRLRKMRFDTEVDATDRI